MKIAHLLPRGGPKEGVAVGMEMVTVECPRVVCRVKHYHVPTAQHAQCPACGAKWDWRADLQERAVMNGRET